MRNKQITLLVLGLFLAAWLLTVSVQSNLHIAHRLASFQLPSFSLASLPPEAPVTRPAMEVVFVLDTTGSMGGLIGGAKSKIWSIINHLNQYQPQPTLRIGLVAFRDRGDDYVTRLTPLSDDLDTIYTDLMALQAGGGGDTPESVNQALYEAITLSPWSQDQETLRIVFLVGDAPPHMNYQGDILYSQSAALAREKGIFINTIQCGNHSGTTPFWKEIAQLGGGEFAQIQQDGGMIVREAPQDQRIAEINRKISMTVVPYGERETRRLAERKMETARGLSGFAAAERQAYVSASAPSAAITGREDLIAEIAAGRVQPDNLQREWLPETMAELDEKALSEAIASRSQQRAELQEELAELLKARSAYLASADDGAVDKNTFDNQVQQIIRRQAAAKSFTHSTPEV